MTRNLRVTHYRNGDPITAHSIVADWSLVRNRGIAPTGWHIASKDEWNTLYLSLGGNASVAQKLKMTGSARPGGGSNTSGFSALLGGFLDDFVNITGQSTEGYWWTYSYYNPGATFNRIRFLLADNNTMQLSDRNRRYGMPERCVKD